MMLKLEYDRLSRTEKNKIVIKKRLKKFKKNKYKNKNQKCF